jgi:hypothetical protein
VTRKLPASLWYRAARSEPTWSDSIKSMGFIVEQLLRPCGSANTRRQQPKTTKGRFVKDGRLPPEERPRTGRGGPGCYRPDVAQLNEAPPMGEEVRSKGEDDHEI